MSTSRASLEQLQRWLQSAITAPAGVAQGEVGDEVLPSRQMTAEERLAVYNHAYFARLLETLRDFFPCLAETLGGEVFTQFALAYLQQHPPQSYTLHRLADHFVRFLEDTQPENAISWTGFWIDLARLEFAIERVFDCPGPERGPLLSHTDLVQVPAEKWAEARLNLVAGTELLAFQFPVSPFYTAWKRGERHPIPRPASTHVALLRRDFVVRRHELTLAQFLLLQELQQGITIENAIATAAEQANDLDEFAKELQTWFQQWAREQFFAAIVLDGGT